MFAKIVILCVVLAAAHASVIGPVDWGWGAPAAVAAPWGLAGKGWAGPALAPLGYGNLLGNGILANGWGVGYAKAPLGLAAPLGLGVAKVW
ncbi:hypothetical protein AVEN_103866-1 [Araneus ventricosus]|uniref:Uncharacterized protein n=1 Tax=Araneus ventricosus TaxID=182803 RepID=A0A4Y2P396_ARAVE|nr:hypothetical protein AVEN_103866-1 [Araneus ventricosus]